MNSKIQRVKHTPREFRNVQKLRPRDTSTAAAWISHRHPLNSRKNA